jgi:hypothetical protein
MDRCHIADLRGGSYGNTEGLKARVARFDQLDEIA